MPQPTLFSFFQRAKPKDSPESASTPTSEKADKSTNGNGAINKPTNGNNAIETTPKINKRSGLNGRNGGSSAKRPKPSDGRPKSASAKAFKRIRMDDSDSGEGEAKLPRNGAGDVEDEDESRDVSPDDSDDDFKPGNEESSDDDMEQECVPSDVESPVKATPKRSKPVRRDLRQTMSGWSASPASVNGSPATPAVTVRSPATAAGPVGDSPRTPSTPACRSATKLKLSGFAAECEGASPCSAAADVDSSAQDWPHLKLEWLKPEKIRDAEGHRPDHPDYNPCTLRVPTEFLDKQTPAMRQWWVLKSSHFDCVLFFKMGKFYEMFHMDAVLCVKELGLLFMKGEHAHVGFPETSFSRYSSALVEKGHRVCRIEQTETPDMMQRRVSQAKRVTKFDRVVAREICQVTSLGTRTFSAVEGGCNEAEFNYLLAIREQELGGAGVEFGVCFVDTSVGEFFLGQFADDCHCSRLRTLLAHHPPVQLLLARTGSSQRCRDVTGGSASCVTDTLRPGHDFWTAEKTLKYLADVDCFSERSAIIGGDTCAVDGISSGQSASEWPQLLVDMTSENDALHQSPRADCDLALQSLGAVIWYLKRCLLDVQLLSMKRFSRYCPPDLETSSGITAGDVPFSAVDGGTTGGGSNGTVSVSESPAASRTVSDMNAVKVDEQPLPKRMVLDGSTLKNLEIVSNMVDGGTECTLLGTLDTCVTAFGKRLLRAWLCGPLTSISSINARLDAISQLISRADVMEQLTAQLKPMPDLDRQLRRIHVQGNARLGDATHPDSRAIMFEEAKYSRAKIGDFLSALSGFQLAQQLIEADLAEDMKSSSYLLKCCLTFESAGGKFPDLSEALRYFQEAFDHDQARKEGKVVPRPGVDVQYDDALQTLEQVKLEADQYLREQCRRFGCKVVYFGSGRNAYQLEMPDSAAKRTDQSYELQSQKKGAKRYWTAVTRELLNRRQSADDALGTALRDVSRRLFASFDRYSCSWQRAVECLALLDALLALARYSRSAEPMCRPQLVAAAAGGPSSLEQQWHQSAVLELVSCHHPWLGRAGSVDFIPNDLTMCRSLLLLTGPNMGGKSTLMRQVGLVIVLAQLGCYVPAESVRLTPFDRIFTRLGAQDHIMSGQSTFHVELSEAASILRHATHRSLVLVDELGRGTSTFDGSAIASAVLRQLLRCACVSLFSTHYHTLVDEFQTNSQVWLGHMSCMVENENADDPTQESITFLYKLVEGACPKSYGFNAAQLAGLPTNVIRNAHQMAVRFQKRVETIARFTSVWKRHASVMVATK